MLDAAEIRPRLVGVWPAVLTALGIDERCLRDKHGPCPACGGRDRFRFDDRDGRGTWICNQCGAGDGFKLLMVVKGWNFAEALGAVSKVAGLTEHGGPLPERRVVMSRRDPPVPAVPIGRAEWLLRTSSAPEDVADVIEYLRSRFLWPLPPRCSLRAHAAAEYWDRTETGAQQLLGRFSAMLAELCDVNGERVTAHATYLTAGRKIDARAPRKLLGRLTGRRGCAVRLMPIDGDTLGIAEGIETALAAYALHHVPVWAATNATLLAKFEPPPNVHHVIIFADRDVAGLEAAIALHEQLDGRATVETRTAPAPAKDWNDVLTARAAQ
jgi:putative DNA primase/helicase